MRSLALMVALFIAGCASADPDATGVEPLVTSPKLPSPSGTGELAPWGGSDPTTWRPDAIIANASASALNEALATPDVVDATAAVPVRMKTFGFEEFGDGQVEAAPSFERWRSPSPPLIATLLAFRDGRLV